MRPRSRRYQLGLGVSGLIIGLGVLAGVPFGSAPRQMSAPAGDPAAQLQTAPFHALIPGALPPGARLMRVETTTALNGTGDIDLEYALQDGRRLHVWETSRPTNALHGKDPTQIAGIVHKTMNANWVEGTGFSGLVRTLSARVGPILVTVDASLSISELLDIADSVH